MSTRSHADTDATNLYPHEAMLFRSIVELAYQIEDRDHAGLKSLLEHLDHQFEAISTHSGNTPVEPDAEDADPNVELLACDPWTEHGVSSERTPITGYQKCIRIPETLIEPVRDPVATAADDIASHYYASGREPEQQLIDNRIIPLLFDSENQTAGINYQ
ncbi:hypothetical protein [Salinibaculum rarum]|uniref:hypothetical protein n=1 Tax=Salinibaculum rarum TaxID=3058903 RepID=UPI00265D7B27|nr:hypothetical protein [Salinibaculum sp. KK48]